MKKTINRKVYNTETATLIKNKTYSFFGDPAGYEETLYQTPKGEYFIYAIGGADSKYAEETIFTVTADEAKEF